MSMTFRMFRISEEAWIEVFPDELACELGWIDGEPVPNPAYRPELDVNLSNVNAVDVLGTLGYFVDEGTFEAPVGEFIERARRYLRSRIGKAPSVTEGLFVLATRGMPGLTMLQSGYTERTVHRLVVLAQEGRQAGATHITAA